MTTAIWILPRIVTAVVLLEFSLSNDLPDPRVRRVFAGLALGLVAFSAVAAGFYPQAASPVLMLAAAGPLVYLLLHGALRMIFKRWMKLEPEIVAIGRRDTKYNRFFFETESVRNVTWMDYLYTILLGLAMGISVSAAVGQIIER